jgi:hypothetical protein
MRTTEEKQKFAILMAMLGTAFGENGISSERIEMYWAHLNDIPADALAKAVDTIIKTRKFSSIPTIAEIRDAALGRDDEIEAAALDSWGRGCRAVERGLYPTGDRLLEESVRVAFGGWGGFGLADPENGVADRAHFIRVFKGLAKSRRDRGEPALEAGSRWSLARGQEVVKKLAERLGK